MILFLITNNYKHCVSADLWAGQQLSEALGAGLRFQEEGGRDDERHREERQYLGSTHLREGPGTQSQHSSNSCYVTVWLFPPCYILTLKLMENWGSL